MGELTKKFAKLFINGEPVDTLEEVSIEPIEDETNTKQTKNEEWVWVEGFKGMEKDMKCRNMQYEIGGRYLHEGDVEMCGSGYHFCLKFKDVLHYYKIGNNHRFFHVRGLVRKSDVEKYDKVILEKSPFGGVRPVSYDKLVAKEIIIGNELTNEEIFSLVDVSDKVKGEEYFEIAREHGVESALKEWQTNELIKCGYSKPFVEMLTHMDECKINRAIAVGSEPELSMDMKCWIIFKD